MQPQGNPLAAMAPQMQQPQQQPAPTHAQTVAALQHFGAIKNAMLPVMDDPKLGKANIRPKLLDSFSKLLAARTLSLPEIMNAIKSLPDDPQQQVAFVTKIYKDNDQAQKMILAHHQMGPPSQGEPEAWSPDNHADQLSALSQQYGRQ
jgi:hypothetical protein